MFVEKWCNFVIDFFSKTEKNNVIYWKSILRFETNILFTVVKGWKIFEIYLEKIDRKGWENGGNLATTIRK